jgi:hypothetical protein
LRQSRKKPGYPGLRYRSGPGAVRRGRFAPLLSLALPKNGLHAIFGLMSFCATKTHTLEPAGLPAGHPCGFSPSPASLEFCSAKLRKTKKAQPFWFGILRAAFVRLVKVNAGAPALTRR